MNYKLLIDELMIRIPCYILCAPLKYCWFGMGWEACPNGGLEGDYSLPRRGVMAWKIEPEGFKLDMGFGVKNIIVHSLIKLN